MGGIAGVTMERREIDDAQPKLHNAPIRPRAWRELVASDDVAAIEGDGGTLVLATQDGQLNLHYAFSELEEMRLQFEPLFEQLKSEIDSFDAGYVRIDLVQLPDRTFIEPLLEKVGFTAFGEWMEMVHQDLDADAPPPQFPEGVAMRRGAADDFERVIEIEAAAFGDLADGEAATAARLADAAWIGLLERDGQIVAYAVTDEVQGAQGRVISAAVDPPSWGNGFGSLVLAAAVYRLTANEARRITMRVRPKISQALRVTQDLGFKPGTRGIEWRRPVDERLIEERREQARVSGVKARFGEWR